MASTHVVAEPRVPQVVITREFDAPRELLFHAHTDPDLLVQWFAPRSRLDGLLARLAPVS
jgi:uncharacterized protein YndB with AHSA1/START domain